MRAPQVKMLSLSNAKNRSEGPSPIGFLIVKTLYPKFEADFRQFYLKTIVSLNRMMESFKIGGENIISKTFKDQLPAFARNFDFY